MTRCCTLCKEVKPLELFSKNKTTWRRCLSCLAKLQKEYRERNLEKCKGINVRSRYKNYHRNVWFAAKKRAERSGVPFTLTPEDVKDLLDTTDVCPILGLALVAAAGKGREEKDDSPSLDRFDPKLGYVPGNVAVISFRANSIKRDATFHELLAITSWMAERADAAAIDAQHSDEGPDGQLRELL